MSIAIQLDFFETVEQSEMASLRMQMASVKNTAERVRKSLYAKNGELAKQVLELQDRLSVIERGICNGSI